MQGVNDRLDLTQKYARNIVPGLLDAVIGDAILGEIVGADLFGTIARTDLTLAVSRKFLSLFLLLESGNLGRQEDEGALTIGILTALDSGTDIEACRLVNETHGRLYLVDVLSSLATRPGKLHLQISWIDLKFELLTDWHDSDGHRRGVNTPHLLSLRHPLDSMNAGLPA